MIWQLLTAPPWWTGLDRGTNRSKGDYWVRKTENLQKRVTTLQLKFDLGDISEEDFTAQEQEILEAMEAEIDENNE